MKLKTIMYSLAYGRSPEALKRSEGARRVKQASCLIKSSKHLTGKQKALYKDKHLPKFLNKVKGSSQWDIRQNQRIATGNCVVEHLTNIKNNSIDNLVLVDIPKKRTNRIGQRRGINMKLKMKGKVIDPDGYGKDTPIQIHPKEKCWYNIVSRNEHTFDVTLTNLLYSATVTLPIEQMNVFFDLEDSVESPFTIKPK